MKTNSKTKCIYFVVVSIITIHSSLCKTPAANLKMYNHKKGTDDVRLFLHSIRPFTLKLPSLILHCTPNTQVFPSLGWQHICYSEKLTMLQIHPQVLFRNLLKKTCHTICGKKKHTGTVMVNKASKNCKEEVYACIPLCPWSCGLWHFCAAIPGHNFPQSFSGPHQIVLDASTQQIEKRK